MQVAKMLGGSATEIIYDYSISVTAVEGTPLIAAVAGGDAGMLKNATTTSFADVVGICIGVSSGNHRYGGNFSAAGAGPWALTYSTTQGDPQGLVRVVANPDQVVRARMSGGATAGTALTAYANTAASAAGTTVSANVGTATMDEGISWCLSGANVGQARRINTFTNSTSFVVTVPYPKTIAVGDTFAMAPYLPGGGTNTIQLTTGLLEADASIAVATGGNARAVELVLLGVGDSFVHLMWRDHVYNELS